ncbi:hypothetical protein B0H13DRAFT_2346787 [Mycena leptocephala]|nr:hypothetical protein B0H13DRAFT_2346787 [Mycena leptocephala]
MHHQRALAGARRLSLCKLVEGTIRLPIRHSRAKPRPRKRREEHGTGAAAAALGRLEDRRYKAGRDADRPRRHLPRTKHTASAYSVKRPRTRLPHRPHAIAPPSYASEWQSPQERDAASPTPAAQARRPELCTRHPRVAPQRTHPRAAQKAIKTEKQSKKREGAYRSPPLPFLKTAARIVDGSTKTRNE